VTHESTRDGELVLARVMAVSVLASLCQHCTHGLDVLEFLAEFFMHPSTRCISLVSAFWDLRGQISAVLPKSNIHILVCI